ncbi:peptidoglycan bridge formation glycyltransferase FemA/FemB family protein [Staphylococcus aureus]
MDTLGYKHEGFPVGYDSMSQIRWLSVLDLKDKTEDQLLKQMYYQTRRNIKKYMNWCQTKTLTIDENDSFSTYSIWRKKSMVSNSVSYHNFQEMQKLYDDRGHVKVGYIDLE